MNRQLPIREKGLIINNVGYQLEDSPLGAHNGHTKLFDCFRNNNLLPEKLHRLGQKTEALPPESIPPLCKII